MNNQVYAVPKPISKKRRVVKNKPPSEIKFCKVCGETYNVHLHHIFYGTANRKLSDKYGFVVYLCAYHHNMSDEGVHFNKEFDTRLKQAAQRKFEAEIGSREEFMKVFGENFL
jgi:hypothetical protein